MGVFVEGFGVGMGGGGIEVVVAFFDVFAVIALVTAEAEQAFFEDGIASIPENRGKAHQALVIAPPLKAIFAPAVGAEAGVIVREGPPTKPAFGIVFAHGSPLAFAEEWAPLPPWRVGRGSVGKSLAFRCHG